jgi:hypothetical protein
MAELGPTEHSIPFNEIGAEPLEDSGFEVEIPEADFADGSSDAC